MKYLLPILCLLSGCGSSPQSTPVSQTVSTGPNQVVISVFNSGTQDSSLGATYNVVSNTTTAVPSIVLRTQGTTDQDGIGVGFDFGNGIGQCYYSADTTSQNVFTLTACTNGMLAGTSVSLIAGQVITVWAYAHVNSSDSIVELVLQGETK